MAMLPFVSVLFGDAFTPLFFQYLTAFRRFEELDGFSPVFNTGWKMVNLIEVQGVAGS